MALQVPRDVTARIRAHFEKRPLPSGASSSSFDVLSWNVDGISEAGPVDLMHRILAVIEHIAATQPAIVLLQEVVPQVLELMSAPPMLGPHYDIVCPDNPRLPYYCAMLLLKRRIKAVGPPRTIHFPTSQMGRHLLSVDVVVDAKHNEPLTVMTTHLESMKTERVERVNQLVRVFAEMATRRKAHAGNNASVLMAGDLNARDDEVVDAYSKAKSTDGGVRDIVDAWEWCGSPSKSRFTWDTGENTNLGVAYKSKCRFDRLFFIAPRVTEKLGLTVDPPHVRQWRGTVAERSKLKGSWRPSSFELVGKTPLPVVGGRFPSDHWGLQIRFWSGEEDDGGLQPHNAAIAVSSSAGAGSDKPPSRPQAVGSCASLSAAGAAVDEQAERRRKRELAAQQAEARMRATPSSSSTCAAPQEPPSSSGDAKAAPLASGRPTAAAPVVPAQQPVDKLVAERQPDDGSERDGDEQEAVDIALAIALSLQSCGGDCPTGSEGAHEASSKRPKFTSLGPSGAREEEHGDRVNSVRQIIDLD